MLPTCDQEEVVIIREPKYASPYSSISAQTKETATVDACLPISLWGSTYCLFTAQGTPDATIPEMSSASARPKTVKRDAVPVKPKIQNPDLIVAEGAFVHPEAITEGRVLVGKGALCTRNESCREHWLMDKPV